jgi:mono/diheme cytochrome c family protein
MLRSSAVRRFLPLAAMALLALGAGCDQPPPAGSLREWSPADHHSSDDEKLAGQRPGQGAAAAAQAPAAKGSDVPQLVELTWRRQCTTCHGPLGRGDGQMGPMVQAPDLTRPEWQSKVSDADIATVIKGGKNKMPKFDLPEPVVLGLVARIRQLKGP